MEAPDPTVHGLRRAAALAFSLVMLVAAIDFCWSIRNQYSHAFPPAALMACLLASVVAAWLGWRWAPRYQADTMLAAVWVPLTVVLVSVLFAAALYQVGVVFWFWWSGQWPVWDSVPAALGRFVGDATYYALASARVWLPGMIIATVWLRRRANRA